ncbi:hypothetical protein [uncultured Oxalicibacterium sp.]|uniref:hypothetical protein n=1 Tax=uncultured Oxalicibacterium sp. TaxID=1168540 RepID=UPI0025D104EE|nr:hypothetical protein [uncultured Oxalicibacterium sp.]
MSERKIPESNLDRMVKKNREAVPQPEHAGTGPESQTYEQRTGIKPSAHASYAKSETRTFNPSLTQHLGHKGESKKDVPLEMERDPKNPFHNRPK